MTDVTRITKDHKGRNNRDLNRLKQLVIRHAGKRYVHQRCTEGTNSTKGIFSVQFKDVLLVESTHLVFLHLLACQVTLVTGDSGLLLCPLLNVRRLASSINSLCSLFLHKRSGTQFVSDSYLIR